MSPAGLRRYRAERLLRKGFPGMRAKVLAIVRSQLRAKGIALDPADLEACYAQAFHGLYATVLGGEEVENPSAWLVVVTFRRAIDESRAAARHTAGGCRPVAGQRRDSSKEEGKWAAPDPDMAGALDDRATLRQVFEGLRGSLTAREREAASLCYLQGLTRAQAAERMGITEARMRKLMEGAAPGRPGVAGKVGGLLATIRAGGWCEQQSSLMRAYAFGILDPDGERHELATVHLRRCPACRAHVASLRGLAAVLPPLPFTLALVGGGGAATGAGAGSGVGGAGAATTAGAGGSTSGIGVGGGLIGGAGSLAAKLAAVAVVAVGAGYALTGGRAHGSPRSASARTATTSSPVPAGALLVSPFATPHAHTHPRTTRTVRRSTLRVAHVRHAAQARGANPTGGAVAREFIPESVTGQPAPAGVQQSTRGGTEFGFE